MFLVRRAIIDIGRKSLRHNFRSYGNTAKHFAKQNASADTNQSTKISNGQNDKDHNENENENQTENEEDKSKQYNHDQQVDKDLMVRGNFEQLTHKNRESFLSMLHLFVERDVHRRHHVEFIYAALKHMKEFGVERDLDVYKEILDIMPKGKFVATNILQAEFMHYPKHQDCAIFLLNEMEYNAVIPDEEMQSMLENIFGNRSHPMYKFWRMLYWMPKFRYLSPWLLPSPVPDDSLELAKLAVRQMCTVDPESAIHIFDTENIEDSLDKTWIVSGQSPEQRKLLKTHSVDLSLRVKGPFSIQLRNRSINYFTLVGDAESDDIFEDEDDMDDVRNIAMPKFMQFLAPKQTDVVVQKPKRSIHQQDDGTIYAICATGTSTKDSLLSWIRLLEISGNPSLAHLPVLFTFRMPVDDRALVIVNSNQNNGEKK